MKRNLILTICVLMVFFTIACKSKQIEPTVAVDPTVAPSQEHQEQKIPIPSQEPEITTEFITVTDDTDLVLEAKILIPNQSFDVIARVSAGQELELIEAGCEWHKVLYENQEVYVQTSAVEGRERADSPYYIYIDKSSHTINIYEMDEDGKYSILLNSYLTATGKTAGKTPAGIFAISKKYEWKQFDSAGTDQPYSYSPYVSQFTDGIYMHGPVFAEQNFETMYGNTYKEIGTNSTAGCLRTNVGSAYWVYMNCPLGTTVEVVNGSDREIETPDLIKPIHDLNKGKYYDPTDPNYIEGDE